MKKGAIITLIIIAVIAVAVIFLLVNKQGDEDFSKTGIILFYGDGCPHCENVDKYIADNGIADKVTFTKKEVFNDEANGELLVNIAKQCKIDTSAVGVPFLWSGERCISGDEDVINFFKEITQ